MFSLVIAIISVVLVGLLSVACVYYLWDTSSRAEEAKVARKVNEASQLAAALQMAALDGQSDTSTSALIANGYLSSRVNDWAEDSIYFENSIDMGQSACEKFNARQGYVFEGIPSCSAPEIASFSRGVCCED